MFDMSWGEMLVIGAVALIVIGPKELPKALRTLGNMTGKLRRMAGEFQGQFNEAMREAELDELRKQVASVNDVATFNPIQTVRDEIRSAIEPKPADTTSAATAAAYQEEKAPAALDLPPPDAPAAVRLDPPAAEAEPVKARVYEPVAAPVEPEAKAS